MTAIEHRARSSSSVHGNRVFPPVYDVAEDPGAQEMLLRLGLCVGECSSDIDRLRYVKQVAATVLMLKGARR